MTDEKVYEDEPAQRDPESPDADRERLKNVRERWEEGLLDQALDPDKTLIQVEDAGMGGWLDAALGGGLQPGNLVGLVSAGAGGGKTAFVHQLADGFGKASAKAVAGAAGSGQKPVVTPILYVTEMRDEDLTIRSLAREAGVQGKLLRAPNSRLGHQYTPSAQEGVLARLSGNGASPPARLQDGAFALWAARQVAEQMKASMEFITILDRRQPLHGHPIMALREHVGRIRETWEKKGYEVAAVILVVDPLHRLSPATEETAELGAVASDLLDLTHGEGLVTLFTSDTTKAAVDLRNAGESGGSTLEQQGELAFRGSYQLVHMPDFALALRTLDPDREEHEQQIRKAKEKSGVDFFERPESDSTWGTVYADLISPKLRWNKVGDRPAFWFDGALFRFVPIPRHRAPRPEQQDGRRPYDRFLAGS